MLQNYTFVSYKNFISPQYNTIGKGKKKIHDVICTLDTETSHKGLEKAWVYQWSILLDNVIVYGRTPSQLVYTLDKIAEVNEDKILCFVHNLSYEFAYLFEFLNEKSECVYLAIQPHKILTLKYRNIEFRCTYRLSGKSLDKWAKELNTKHKKLVGEIDYNVIRYQDTPLIRKDWRYMFYDVVVLKECVLEQLRIHGDTLLTIPLTVTGYVRRDVRNEYKKDTNNRKKFLDTKLNADLYIKCRRAFAGGLTHGNRFYADIKQVGTIRHRDFRSHYPSQQRAYFCPIGRFNRYYTAGNKKEITLNDLKKLSEKYCFLITFVLEKCSLRDGITLPTLQVFKVYQGRLGEISTVEDNGRILDFEGTTLLTMCDSDFFIFCEQYKARFYIESIDIAVKGRYPEYMRKCIDNYFFIKTDVKEKLEDITDEAEYWTAYQDMMIAKGKLNGIYGMTATNPLRDEFTLCDGIWTHKKIDDTDIQIKLDEFYKSYNSFNRYQFGVWTTATARAELVEFVKLIGYENYIYCDTDSIFYHSTPEIEKRISEYNKQLRKRAERMQAYIKTDKSTVYYDEFVDENEDIIAFKFLHSKCYAYETSDKKLHTVIAGVSAKGRKGATRVKELGSIDNLAHGKIFKLCGGTRTVYGYEQPHTEFIDGHKTQIGGFAIITDNEKTLNGLIATGERFIEWSVNDEY